MTRSWKYCSKTACGDGFEQAIDDVQLVKKWELDGDRGQIRFGKIGARSRDEVFVAPEIDDLLDAVRAVNRERPENREIDD